MLKKSTDTFGEIAVKPTEDDISRMVRTILPILLKIPYDEVDATHNLSGLISPSAKYTSKYGTAFNPPMRPKPYSPTINATMSDVERRKSEVTHSSHK